VVYWKEIEVYFDDYKLNKRVFSRGISCMNKRMLCVMLLGITFVWVS
jgi:hypothetical protein